MHYNGLLFGSFQCLLRMHMAENVSIKVNPHLLGAETTCNSLIRVVAAFGRIRPRPRFARPATFLS